MRRQKNVTKSLRLCLLRKPIRMKIQIHLWQLYAKLSVYQKHLLESPRSKMWKQFQNMILHWGVLVLSLLIPNHTLHMAIYSWCLCFLFLSPIYSNRSIMLKHIDIFQPLEFRMYTIYYILMINKTLLIRNTYELLQLLPQMCNYQLAF